MITESPDTDAIATIARPNFGACQIEVKERSYRDCQHRAIAVDEHGVECANCKKPLNPIAVLMDFAKRERRLRGWETALSALLQEIEKLKAERQKLKVAIRRSKV